MRLTCLLDLIIDTRLEIFDAHVPQRGQRWELLAWNVILEFWFTFSTALELLVVLDSARESSSTAAQIIDAIAVMVQLLRLQRRIVLRSGTLATLVSEWVEIDLPLDTLKLLIEGFNLLLKELSILSCVIIKDSIEVYIDTCHLVVFSGRWHQVSHRRSIKLMNDLFRI